MMMIIIMATFCVAIRFSVSLASFSCQLFLAIFLRFLSHSKFPQVTRTLPSSLVNLCNAINKVVSILPLISKSTVPLFKILGNVPSAPSTIGISLTLMFHNVSSSMARSKYLSIFSLPFISLLWSAEMAKSTILQALFFFFFVN